MIKQDVIKFFDHYASQWDADMIRNDSIINTILDNAGVFAGTSVLDVACGTGVLIPDYLKRDVNSVLAIDISSKMIEIAQKKFQDTIVQFVCADIETVSISQKFDCCVVYNAFPHFPSPENLIRVLADMLNVHGTLTIAHGMNRAKIDQHHKGAASNVSLGLMSEDALSELMNPYFTVTTKISNDSMYQVTGIKRTNHILG
ncbi:MAG: class I SAM-dependent methyltransferase [Velocimicrobium sp.]